MLMLRVDVYQITRQVFELTNCDRSSIDEITRPALSA